jgi:hypothetical protein
VANAAIQANRKSSVLVAALLTFLPALALYPAILFCMNHFPKYGSFAGFALMLVCAAAESSGLILASRAMAGAFDVLEVGAIACLVAGVIALGAIAWALATGFFSFRF